MFRITVSNPVFKTTKYAANHRRYLSLWPGLVSASTDNSLCIYRQLPQILGCERQKCLQVSVVECGYAMNLNLCPCVLVQTSAPVAIINGHSKAVSYVRWMGTSGLVSASTDNSLKLWDVKDVLAGERVEPITTFTGDAPCLSCLSSFSSFLLVELHAWVEPFTTSTGDAPCVSCVLSIQFHLPI